MVSLPSYPQQQQQQHSQRDNMTTTTTIRCGVMPTTPTAVIINDCPPSSRRATYPPTPPAAVMNHFYPRDGWFACVAAAAAASDYRVFAAVPEWRIYRISPHQPYSLTHSLSTRSIDAGKIYKSMNGTAWKMNLNWKKCVHTHTHGHWVGLGSWFYRHVGFLLSWVTAYRRGLTAIYFSCIEALILLIP